MDESDGEYPRILSIFPLTGALLLPGSRLPLHIFEPRYLALVQDALDSHRYMGMIQPLGGVDEGSSAEDTGSEGEAQQLYGVGCVGRIDRWERLADGRYILLLEGVSRFRIQRELPLQSGYRRVEVDYGDFSEDTSQNARTELDADDLLEALRVFGRANQLELDLDKLRELSGLAILNSLAMALPFAPAEKQALLEAADVDQRHQMLLSLMDMGLDLRRRDDPGLEQVH